MSEDNKTKPGKFWKIFSILLILTLGISFILNFILGGMLALTIQQKESEDKPPTFHTKALEGKGKSKILLISIEGVIAEGKFLGQTVGNSPEQIRYKLNQALQDDAIKAVVIKIDSPGGTIAASDSIYKYIKEFRKKSQKPVVAYLNAIAASGGYYVAVACDEIIAHPTSLTGSIGVIMQYFQIKDLLENKLGIRPVVIKSGNYKDMASAFRNLPSGEEKILTEMIEEMYQRFLEVVAKGRPRLALQARQPLYLFSLDEKCQNDLDAGIIGEGLKAEFASKRNAPGPNAVVKIVAEKGKWIIEDKENSREYTVDREGNALNVYVEGNLRQLADGRIYTANQALKYGLIDSLGYFPDAIARARSLAGVEEKDCKVVSYEPARSFIEKILDPAVRAQESQHQLAEYFLQQCQTPSFYYLWQIEK